MLIFLHICIKHSQHYEMRKNNSKLNFMKNCQASLFSRGQLKISKCSTSLAWLGECAKSKVTPLLADCSQLKLVGNLSCMPLQMKPILKVAFLLWHLLNHQKWGENCKNLCTYKFLLLLLQNVKWLETWYTYQIHMLNKSENLLFIITEPNIGITQLSLI